MILYTGINPGGGDWYNNLRQARGGVAPFYDQAAMLATKINSSLLKTHATTKLSFTGHSLGGGLATLAATITNRDAYLVNPAYLSETTLNNYGKTISDVEQNTKLHHVYVDGEVLNYTQHQTWLTTPTGNVLAEPLADRIRLTATNQNGTAVDNGLIDRTNKHLRDMIYGSWQQTIAEKLDSLSAVLQKGVLQK